MKLPLSWIKEYLDDEDLPNSFEVDLQFSGTKIESTEKVGDGTILDFEITPNRADCFGVIGIAREIAAIYGKKLVLPTAFSETKISKERQVNFSIDDKKLCPQYSVGIIEEVKNGQSPPWLQSHLKSSGIRSLNNIVDITNFVMIETGQPMHAFDFNKIEGNLNLRASRKGESLITLDGIERKLPTGSIVIEDSQKIVDLAGLMGGKSSEVDKNTTAVLLHVPLYDPFTIRKTSQELALRTEASGRFEKRLDPNGHRFAFERAAELFQTLCGGRIVSEIKSVGYPVASRKIRLPISLISRTLGINIETSEIEAILGRLEFSTASKIDKGEKILEVEIPTFRTDIKEPIDITEEVGRLFGYNKFPKTLPTGKLPEGEDTTLFFDGKVKKILAGLGVSEIYGSPLSSLLELENLGINGEDCLKVSNRLVIDYEYLRSMLLVSLLSATRTNIEHVNKFSLFEAGRVYENKKGEFGLPLQPKRVAAVFVDSSFSQVKGVLEALLNKLNVKKVNYQKSANVNPFGKNTSEIVVKDKKLGVLGEIDSKYLSNLEINHNVFAFEIDMDTLQANSKETVFVPPLKYPTVKEDISIFVPNGADYETIVRSIKNGAKTHFYDVGLVEDTVIDNKRSILLRIEYFDEKKTLEKSAINKIRENVLEELKKIGTKPRTTN